MEWKDNKYDSNNYFNSKDKLYKFQSPLIMGIVNLTSDSFYSGSRTTSIDTGLERVNTMIEEGVECIDIGGISTRPNANLMTEEEELNRVLPFLKVLRTTFPDILISIDTFRSEVARQTVDFGADIINDVYGGRYDNKMVDTVASLNVPYILMHSRGFSDTMQTKCNYKNVLKEVIYELSISIEQLRKKGVKDIIIDPGFGFSKTTDQNYQLLKGLAYFNILDCPILVGISRKSMIYKLLDTSPEKSLPGTIALNTLALINGASVIRVHDVKEAVSIKKILTKMNTA